VSDRGDADHHAPLFIDVVLPVPVDHPFTYAVPPAFCARVAVGMRAVVPVLSRIETGYVVAVKTEADRTGLKSIYDLPDEQPVFNEEMMRLCGWVADYYCCSLGEALQCAVPAGIKLRSVFRYHLVQEQLTSGKYNDVQRAIVAALFRQSPQTEKQLAAALGEGVRAGLQSLARRGIVRAESGPARAGVSISTESWVRLIEEAVPSQEELERLQRRAPKQAALYLDLLHGEPQRRMAGLLEKHGTDSPAVKALEKRGLIERFEQELYRAPAFAAEERSRQKLTLNPEQQAAFGAITSAMDAGEFKTLLLNGVTGSGKTEVYLQAIEHALALGRSAIVLVPEISLTPQTVGRFIARFQERIAVLHSGLSQGERYDEWRRAQRGEVRIIVGARSAIFAPVANLGIIVVDEEHDNSYKQSDTPRYHARDVAIMRAKNAGAVCVLGSATPSLESYFNCERKKFERLDLANRATASPLPEVRIVDMRNEKIETAGEIILSRQLDEEVNARVALGEQVILLLNRRGFSPFVLCPKCGWVAECANCNVSLTYHASGAALVCHYCSERHPVPAVCGKCGFKPLLFLGTGTQKVEDALLRSFPEARIERMDADTTSTKGSHARILGRFAAGEIDILVGTQMIAKGHDYPGVTLVGVVNADTGLSIPDFRAAENTFQLLTQVAGRAGRGDRPGTVIIQTYRPHHYSIQAASLHDYTAFFQREMIERRRAGYPPLQRMANLAIEADDPIEAERAAAALCRIVRGHIAKEAIAGTTLLGPSPAPVYRVKKRYRWNLAVLSRRTQNLNAIARAARAEFTGEFATGKIVLKIDLDPYGF
jgi:primosomal protein N' (replication factor Y)